MTEHTGGLCQNFDIYKREAECTDRLADKWGNWIYFSISQTLASKTEIDLLSVFLILQFCKQYNLKTVSTSPKFSFQFHLLKFPVTLYFCECLKPMKMSAAVKRSVLIFPSPCRLICPSFLPYSPTSVWALNQVGVRTKAGKKWWIWVESTSLAQGQFPRTRNGIHPLLLARRRILCHKPLTPNLVKLQWPVEIRKANTFTIALHFPFWRCITSFLWHNSLISSTVLQLLLRHTHMIHYFPGWGCYFCSCLT